MCTPDFHLSNAEKPSSLAASVREIFFFEFSLSIYGADNSLLVNIWKKPAFHRLNSIIEPADFPPVFVLIKSRISIDSKSE